MKSFNIVYFS